MLLILLVVWICNDSLSDGLGVDLMQNVFEEVHSQQIGLVEI